MFFRHRIISLLLITALIFTGLPLNNFVYALGEPEITSITLIATTNADGQQTLKYQIYGKNFDNPVFWIDGKSVNEEGYEVDENGAYLIINTPNNNDLFEGGRTHTFIVQNKDGVESAPVDFTVKVVPWVTSVSSSKVYIGEPLTIYGTGIDGDINEVIIGGNPYTSGEFQVNESEQKIYIESVKPAQFPRNGDVKVIKYTDEGYEIQGIYKSVISVVGRLEGVEVDRIEPNAGSVDGGTKVRILGTEGNCDFRADMKIYVDKVDDSNRFTNIELIYDDNENVIGISGITPQSPTGEQGVFSIIITDNTGANELVLENAFTYEDKDNLLKLSTINPPYGKEASEDETVEITGRNIITLNLPNLVDWTVNDAVYADGSYFDFDKNALIVNYLGKYRVDEQQEDWNVEVTREIKLILGKTTEFSYDMYSPAVDKITAKVPTVTEPGTVTVTMQTTTTLRDINTGEFILSRNEEYSLYNGFTFLPATTTPIIESIEPSRGPVDDVVYLTIRGSNFQVLTQPNPENPDEIIPVYPIIKVGNKTIDPNDMDVDDFDGDNNPLPKDPDWVEVYDNENNLVNGVGRILGTVIKTAIPANGDQTTVGLVDVTIINPDMGQSEYTDDPTKKFEFLKHTRTEEEMPHIDKITPDMGSVEGGNTIIIEGENFHYQLINPDVTVTIDGQEAEIIKATSTKIEAIVPPGITIGEKPVQVITEDGATDTIDPDDPDEERRGYTYIRLVAEPEIEDIAPSFGGEGTVVYIFGVDKGPDEPNFFASDPNGDRIEEMIGTRVLLNSIDINDDVYYKVNGEISHDGNGNVFEGESRVQVIDENTLRIVIPGGFAPGPKDLTIINPDTSTVTIEDGFYYKKPPSDQPVEISEIEPDLGSSSGGDYVTITGQNFKDGVKVFFGGKEATEVSVSGSRDRIYLRTPAYPIQNPDLQQSISVDVTVVNYDGSSATSSPEDGGGYTFMVPQSEPVINEIIPSEGTTIGGEWISIEGRDFRKYFNGETYVYPKVYFGSTLAKNVVYMNDTELYVETPFYGDEGSVDVTVINPGDDFGVYVKTNGFTYRMTKPVIEEVVPALGHKLGGQEIIVKGKELLMGDFSEELDGELLDGEEPVVNVLAIFGDEKDENRVIFGESENLLGDVTVEYNDSRTEPVELYNGDMTTDSILIYHKDIEKPIVHYDLQPDERHLFIIEWEEILGEKVGAEGILVELRDNTLISTRRVAPKAEVLDSVGEDGERTIEIQIPPVSIIGERNLYIENKDRGWASTTFEYVSPASKPVIETITPRSEVKNPQDEVVKYYVESTIEGGLYITIEGYDLRQNVEVYIDSTPAPLISRVVLPEVDDEGRLKTRIVVKSPKGNMDDLNKELRIMVVNQDGGFADSSLLTIPYFFVYRIPESKPYIESVLPEETSQAGGNRVRIIGYDFRTGAKVLIAGRECEIESINNDEIVIVTPTDLTSGVKDIQVVNADYGAVTRNSAITVVSYPRITTVTTEGGQTVDRVSIEGGQVIVLTGQNFQQGARVYFGGSRRVIGASQNADIKGLFRDDKYYILEGTYEADKVEFVDEHKLIVTIPEVFEEGELSISVINPDGGLSDDNRSLDYREPIPSDPVGLEAEIVNEKYIRIYGYSSSNAAYYEIYAYLGEDYPDDEDFKYLDTTEKTSYKITKFKDIGEDEDIYLRIRAVNKYGPSQWSNIVKISYEDLEDIDGIGDEDEDGDLTSNYQESADGNGVNVVLGDRGLRGSEYSYYIIDLTDSRYKGIDKRIINIPGKLIKESSRIILVDNGDNRIQFNPRNFYTYSFYSKSSQEQNRTYGSVILDKLKGSYSDYIERKISRKYKLLSKVYDLQIQLQTDQHTMGLDNISGSMDIEITYDENRLMGMDENKLQIFKYDPEKGEWIGLAGGVDKETNRVYARIYGPGQYAILGIK